MSSRERRLAEYVYEFARADDLEQFRSAVTCGVRSLVAADLASYTEVDLSTGQASAPLDPPIDADNVLEAFGRLAHQHPLITRTVSDAEAISDYLTARRLHSLELYQDVYRQLEAEDQLAINLQCGPRRVVGLALNRSRRGFSARDRATLNTLRPLLANSYQRASARTQARNLLSQLDQGRQDRRTGVIALDHEHRIQFASDHAYSLLHAYLQPPRGCALPEALTDWLSGQGSGAGTRLTVPGDTGEIEINLLTGGPSDPLLLTLRERSSPPPDFRLTARERQVLDLASSGAPNKEIADRLEISTQTVANHLTAIYRKLEVHNRTAAVARNVTHPS